MNKYFFAKSDLITKLILLVFALWFFSFKTLLGVTFVFCLPLFYIFRQKKMNVLEKRTVEDNILLSPVTGKFVGEIERNGKKQLLLKVGFLDGFGIYFPFCGDVDFYFEDVKPYKWGGFFKLNRSKVQTKIKSKNNKKIKLKFKSLMDLNKAVVHVRGGDRGLSGALLGYLPFGGKVVIEMPIDSKVLVKKGDKLFSTQTLLANLKE